MTQLADTATYKSFLLTDLYQLTMAQAYWEAGYAQHEACFHLYFRTNPFQGAYAVACGMAEIPHIVQALKLSNDDREYLESCTTNNGTALFKKDFLNFLQSLSHKLEIACVQEGEVVFAHEPLVRVRGNLISAQLIETLLLNTINFQTLVATKAARMKYAAGPQAAIHEFGLRRAQGENGAMSATRAAFIGGCSHTSNVWAGKHYNIPLSGTHAHALVMAFPSELDAFRAYAASQPDNTTLLIDTYSIDTGLEHALIVARELAEQGKQLQAVRIDSGDLARISKYVRNKLDSAGFYAVKIVVSNDLDEYTIASLCAQHAPIDCYGVGTRLVTGAPDAALNGVYKLSAIKHPQQPWRAVIKISEQAHKLTIPGILSTRRYIDAEEKFAGDMIYNSDATVCFNEVHTASSASACITDHSQEIVDPEYAYLHKDFTGLEGQELLFQSELTDMTSCYNLNAAQAYAYKRLNCLRSETRRFLNPQVYPVGIERNLYNRRSDLITRALSQRAPSWR